MLIRGRGPDDGIRTALARTDRLELLQLLGCDGQDIALLRLVAPDLHRRHARIGVGYGAQIETSAASGIMDQLGQGVGQPARADVVDEEDGIVLAERPAAVDDLLAATLHLRVGALHGGKIQILGRGARGHARGRPAAEPDQHRRTAEYDQRCADREAVLGDMLGADVAETAGEHDGLVIAAQLGRAVRSGDGLLEGAEVTRQVGPAELVVEGGGADRPFKHDVECGDDTHRLAVVIGLGQLPRLAETGDAQVRDREAAETRLGLGAPSGRPFVADLPARAGRRARIRRDRGRVVVGLHLHEDRDGLFMLAVDPGHGVGEEAPPVPALDDGGVVLVGGKHALGGDIRGVTDHLKERVRLRLAVDVPAGVEDLVPTMFRVGLREHHQLDIGRITLERLEAAGEIGNLVG